MKINRHLANWVAPKSIHAPNYNLNVHVSTDAL